MSAFRAHDFAAPAVAEQIQQRSLLIGAAAGVLVVIGLLLDSPQFFRSFLLGYVFWASISLGCLALLMMQHLTGGIWGYVIRRVLEAGARVIFPLMAALFLVLVFGMDDLYLWARPETVRGDKLLQYKALFWLNQPAFWARAVFYFAIWGLLAAFLTRWSRYHDRTGDPLIPKRMEGASGPGLVLYGLTVTFASVDWVMSLDPHWFSTMFGVLFMGGQALAAMAFVIAMVVLLARHDPMRGVLHAEHLHDLGKLLLAFVMLWAYFAFSQLLIIWSGNLPEETAWYVHRFHGGWQYIGVTLVIAHFVLPFLLLLSRDIKRHARKVVVVAALVLAMRYVDLHWLIMPNFEEARHGFTVHWLDVVMPVAIGGLWMAVFFWNLRQAPLLPLNDPCFVEVVGQGHARD